MKKIKGYTTGVFDLFHIGHLNILKNAKAQCDFLIVGVSTDELVKKYKNKTPVIPFEERIAIVAALKCVDMVVAQKDMDKVATHTALKYDKVFVGSDWQGTEKWNSYVKDFSAIGVDVIFLPHTEGVSSTLLAKKLELR